MELWIRSQDRKYLIKVDDIQIETTGIYNGGVQIRPCEIYANGLEFCIGEYPTKERALEVLDEIQKVLEQPQKHIEGDYTYYMPNDGSSKIYEMPKE